MPNNIDVERMLAELRLSFVADLPSRLQEIEELILNLKNSGSFIEDYQDIYRHVHSVKGSAGTHGLHIISNICHVLEDKVIEVEGNQELISGEFVTRVLGFIDLLRSTLDLINDNVDDFSNIEVELERLGGKGSEYEFKGLLIMASALHREMVVNAFEKFPVKFHYATNGYDALGILLKEPFDLLVTNMEVSDLQGLALIGALRMSSNRNREIPSILLTTGKLHTYGRNMDPSYVIAKDAQLMKNLNVAASEIVKELNDKLEA